MHIHKKDIRKIKNATREDLIKLQEEYKIVMTNVGGMSPSGLLVIAFLGIVVILYFQNTFLDIIGLVMLLYPIYVLIQRGAHRKGYFEGYYEMMSKLNNRDDSHSAHSGDHTDHSHHNHQ